MRNIWPFSGFNSGKTMKVYGVKVMKGARRGFSAMELIIIVIAALVLLAILLPALARLRDASREGAFMKSPNPKTVMAAPACRSFPT